MRLSYIATACLAISESTVQAASLPQADALSIHQNVARSPRSDILVPENALEKRKGGGGKGGGGGSSSGGKSGGSSSSSSSSRAPNVGGSTASGSGAARSFGGGKVYGGGASVPYKAGGKTNSGLVAGGVIGLGAAAVIMPGLWLYSVYPYYYHNPYRFYNQSSQKNETLPVVCLCQENSTCGCDEAPDQANVKELVGNGSYAGFNKSQITVSDVNGTGTQSIVINGTLPDGTTAPGGTDAGVALGLQYGGYWVAGLIVVYTCAFM